MSNAWAGGSSRRWRVFRELILLRDAYTCQIKGPKCLVAAPLKGGHVDHIQPLSKGGAKYDPMNARAACASCNRSKGDRIAERPPIKRITRWDI